MNFEPRPEAASNPERHSTVLPEAATRPVARPEIRLSQEDVQDVETLVAFFRLNYGLKTSDFPPRENTSKYLERLKIPPQFQGKMIQLMTLLYRVPELSQAIDQKLKERPAEIN